MNLTVCKGAPALWAHKPLQNAKPPVYVACGPTHLTEHSTAPKT